jgi:hypothetical protein
MHPIFSSWLFYFMAAHLAILIFLCIKNFKFLCQSVINIDKKIWLLLILIFVFSFSLRNSEYWLGPFSDGYVAQESARMWVLNGDYVKSCALGTPADCKIPEQVLFPAGYPFLIVLAHLIFGIHSLNASVISAILSSLTTIIVFLVTFFISKKENAGLYAALIFSFIPFNIVYSQTGETRPTGLFFEGLAILLFLIAVKNNRIINWLAVAASASYAIYVRQESYVLVPIMLLFFVIFKWRETKAVVLRIINKYVDENRIYFDPQLSKIFFIFLLFFILQIPVLRWLLFNNPYQSYQGGGFFALHHKGIMIQGKAIFLQFFNAVPDSLSWANIFHYNIVSSILLLVAIVVFILIPRKKHIFILSILVGYYIVYSLMFDGNIQGTGQLTGDYFRRATMFHISYAVISGIGFCFISPFKKKTYVIVNLLILFFVLLFSNYSYFQARYVKETPVSFYFPMKIFQDSRATKSGDRSIIYPDSSYWHTVSKLPKNCLVVMGMYLVATNDYFKDFNFKTASIDMINYARKDIFLKEFEENQCIIYLSDYRCMQSDYACQFLDENLTRNFLFQEGGIKAYSAQLK